MNQNLPLFSRQELLERVDGDEELLREVLLIYMEDTPSVLESLKQGIDANSPEAVAKAAHTLKGSSANIAAERLRRRARELEQKAQEGDLEGAAAFYDMLESEFHALKEELRPYLGE
ncbi:MAG: Hpt domain-containing protein [Desulfosalsimonadaceae bacterium]